MTNLGSLLLSSTGSRAIKTLSDFKPSHKVPKEVNAATRKFAKTCAATDIQLEMEAVWTLCREIFQYKRKDKVGPIIEGGVGTITFPDFRFTVTVEQDEKSPQFVVWHRSVDEIKSLHTILGDSFNQIFAKTFDTLEADFSTPKKIEDLIDRVEDLNSKIITVEYPADCSHCQILLKESNISIHVSPTGYKITLSDCSSTKALVEKILEIQNTIREMSSEDSLLNFS